MIGSTLSLPLMTEPVMMTFVLMTTDRKEQVEKRSAVIAVVATRKGYMLAALDAYDGSTICMSSPDAQFYLTPLEAVQLLKALDGMQVVTLTGAQENQAEEFNHLIQALRGTLYGRKLVRLAQKFGEQHPEAWIVRISARPSDIEMAFLMEHFSRDRGYAFYTTARRIITPAMQRQRIISAEELWWLRIHTAFLDC